MCSLSWRASRTMDNRFTLSWPSAFCRWPTVSLRDAEIFCVRPPAAMRLAQRSICASGATVAWCRYTAMPSASSSTPTHAAPDLSVNVWPPASAAHHEATTSTSVHAIILPMAPRCSTPDSLPHRLFLTSTPARSVCTNWPACFSACICL